MILPNERHFEEICVSLSQQYIKMEVRDIFALRKEKGKAEEAYRAISEIFAVHQGPHTNICMFWCASDLLRQRIKEKNVGEARRLLGQMVKVYPMIKDDDRRAARAISRAALDLDKLVKDFNLVFFMPWFNKLTDEDWQPATIDGRRVPSLGQQIVNHLMRDITNRDAAYIEQVTEIFRIALQRQPHYKENLRHLAQMQAALSRSDKAIDTYKNLIRRYHDSYLYWELAALIDHNATKTALICMAIVNQRREEFRAKYHLELAVLLLKQNFPSRAAYELRQHIGIRNKQKQSLSPFVQRLWHRLEGVQPVSQADEQALYDRSKAFVTQMLLSRT